ncbi:unnamed protein product, partial [Laminaria digitata]
KAEYTVDFTPLAMTSSSPPPPDHHETTRTTATPSSSGDATSGGQSLRHQHHQGQEEGEVRGEDGRPLRLLGSLFFALPDGGAVLYRLEGLASGPEAASTMELETPAKRALAFTVPVCNWLRRSQRCVFHTR